MSIVDNVSNDSLDREDWLDRTNDNDLQKVNNLSPTGSNNVKSLFLHDPSSPSLSSPILEANSQSQNIIPPPTKKHRFYEDSSSVFVSPKIQRQPVRMTRVGSKTHNILSPERNRKRRSHISRQDKKIGPWDFNKYIKREFNNNKAFHDIQWKKVNNTIGTSIMQLIEGDMNIAIDETFQKYDNDLQYITNDKFGEIDRIYNLKQKLMNQILDKIYDKLRDSSLPIELKDTDLDVEYIVGKRSHIQERYTEEMRNVESLEIALQNEKEKLLEVKSFLKNLKQNKDKSLNEKLLQNDLHPALMQAIQNAYGLIKSTSSDSNKNNNKITNLKRDIAEFNLVPSKSAENEHELKPYDEKQAEVALPALKEYNTANLKLTENVSNTLSQSRLKDTVTFFNDFNH